MTDKLTPYDTGKRLEPQPWTAEHRKWDDDYGKVDFDNEESTTEAIVYIEKSEPGYTLHASSTGSEPLKVELMADDEPVLVTQPSPALQANVRDTIQLLHLPFGDEPEVYWAANNRRALILVGGEKHVRKQLLIQVTDVGDGEDISAYVKNWADGIRDTRI